MVLFERVNKRNKTNVLFCGTVHYVLHSRLRIQPFPLAPRRRGRFTGETSAIPKIPYWWHGFVRNRINERETFLAAMSEKTRLYSKAMLYNVFLNGWSCQRHFTHHKDSFLALITRERMKRYFILCCLTQIGTETHLGPAEKGIYAYGDLSSLFSTMNRNGSKVCNKKYHGQPLFTPKPRDRNHQCETTVLVALVMS